MNGLTDTKTEKVADIIKSIYPEQIERLLVVGCGDGVEAAILAQRLDARVTGIDITDKFHPSAVPHADLRIGNAMDLEFDAGVFDFVYSYHALEHIADPRMALAEMFRVLRPGGGFWIGTPNRARIVGYIGAKDAALAEKLRWNVSDYRARITGRFRNELGAHAGFTNRELREMLSAVFPRVEDITDLYFRSIYDRRRWATKIISSAPFSRFIYPSIYFHGTK